MNFNIDIINMAIVFVMLINSVYGLLIYSRNRKDKINSFFFFLTVSISAWSLTMLGYRGFLDHDNVLAMSRLLYFSAISIPVIFLYFCFYFTDRSVRLSTSKIYLPLIIPLVLAVMSLIPGAFIYDVMLRGGRESIIVFNMSTHIAFGVYVISYFSLAYYIILKKYREASGILKTQLAYIFAGTFSSMFITLITNLGLLYVGIFDFNWAGQVGILVMISCIFYSIVRHRLFNIKVLATELFVFSLWVFLLIRIFFSETTQDGWINISLLAITIGVGLLLVRSVIKEVRNREKIEKLATDLEAVNVRLTELDRQKSEFVSFATHQLRAPLTAMKGYASMIMDGDMGSLSDEAQVGVSRIFDSAKTLTNIVDDYLNVTRIELGSMKYAFETISWKNLIEDILAELKPSIEKSKLNFSFTAEDPDMDYRITADPDKFKQVIGNLIDNAMKYTPQGSVALSLSFDRAAHHFVFRITDSGIGIAPEILPHLFLKWSRASNAHKTNIKGTGLGLYVAREIITAHHGSVRAESAGEGKGSTFVVEMEPFGKM